MFTVRNVKKLSDNFKVHQIVYNKNASKQIVVWKVGKLMTDISSFLLKNTEY